MAVFTPLPGPPKGLTSRFQPESWFARLWPGFFCHSGQAGCTPFHGILARNKNHAIISHAIFIFWSQDMSQFHSLSATSLRGQTVQLSDFAGRLVLVVNTASQCGFTPQYAGLEALYQKYRDQGLVILGFPCNQFGQQEPGGADEIAATCQINYGVSFPMFAKVDVNGPAAHPLFQYLTSALPGLLGRKIRWNFTKFLIGRDGKPLRRFATITKPEKIEPYIRAALGLQ
jgi:glutathione peroxidase